MILYIFIYIYNIKYFFRFSNHCSGKTGHNNGKTERTCGPFKTKCE